MRNTIPSRQRCVICWERFRQRGCAGMCRQCFREVEDAVQLRLEIGPKAPLEEIRLAFVPPSVPSTGRRTVTVDGTEFVVVWDGSMSGAAGRGVPLAEDRADSYNAHQGRPPVRRSPHLPGA